MTDILSDFSHGEVCRALEGNVVEVIESWTAVPGCVLERDPDLLRYKTGIPHPLFNGVAMANLEEGLCETRIEEVRNGFADPGLPMVWWTGPSTRPGNLGRVLANHGFTHSADCRGMAVRIADLPSVPEVGGDLRFGLVETISDLEAWVQAYALFFDLPPAIGDDLVRLFSGSGFDGPWHRYMAVKDGNVIATSSLLLGGSVAGIYDVATAEPYRGRGIGRAMTLRPLRDAGAKGYHVGVLGSTPAGYPLYRKIGFKEFCTLGLYLPAAPTGSGETDVTAPCPGEVAGARQGASRTR